MNTTDTLVQADDMLARGRARNAAHLLAPVVGRQPENTEAWHRMARAHLELGDAEAGLRAARAAWQLDPYGAESLYWVSRACTELARHPEAIDAAANACRQDPGNPRLHLRLAEAQLAAGLVAEAEDGLRIAVELAGYDADLWVAYGVALFAAGRPLSAREILLRALTIDPAHQGARHTMARFELAMRPVIDAPSLARASDTFAESLRIRPGGRVRQPDEVSRDALGHAARVTLAWCMIALCALGVISALGIVAVPVGLYLALICAGAAAGCGAALTRPAPLT
ncbi:tetratricopeptide repeat protein [Actinoplanes sp. NPDC051851]|uniref:tetratricopeptide repeat protein n=1 Tax=Actinoplanes sp. NPDC051851 TaxID=3154753 RepID=UPI00343817AD